MLTNAYEIPFTLAAGASLVLPAGSFEFVYLSSISAGASVRLKGSQVSIDLVVGRRVEFGNPTIQPLTLENKGSGSVSGVLLVGSGDVRDSNVVGTVSVTNADKDRSLSGRAFYRGVQAPAVAARYSCCYIANPAGSGLFVFVNKMRVSQPTTAVGLFHLFSSSDYVSMEADAGFSFLSSEVGDSKMVGNEDGSTMLRKGDGSGAFPVEANTAGNHRGAERGYELDFTEPFVVPQGAALGVGSLTVNEEILLSCEWFEESV